MLGLWRTMALFAIVGVITTAAVLAVEVVPTPGGTAPPVPMNTYAFQPPINPSAGYTTRYYLTFSVKKTIPLAIEFVKPKAVVKFYTRDKPSKWVNGNPVWVHKKFCSCARGRMWFDLSYAKGLKTGDKVKLKFIFSSPNYSPVIFPVKQTVINYNN